MSRRANTDKLVAWSPVILLAGLAALTYWLNAQIQPSTARRDGASRHDPDMYIENFRAVTYGTDGAVLQSLAAKHAQHYPDDDSIDLNSPSLVLTDPGKPRLTISSDAGTVSGNREIVTLRGNVRATRDAETKAPERGGAPLGEATFTTDMLRVLPKESRAETDRLVTIQESRGIIQGVGMVYDNDLHTFKLKSSVRGTLQPNNIPK
ncbi:MAG TPA: LPS export ABC transporter periplasmic protein LptC [Casimicrobiaceae bacterium]|nr:LPS export ABC transporter periplasmic protein LptC [Casimicrobiaceae bacterium]